MKRLFLLVLSAALAGHAQEYTRGIGVYPGDPKQYDGPSLVIDSSTYRNLALHRAAYQSSAYDYNLTAQLITDGIKGQSTPRFMVTSTSSGGVLDKQERDVFLDGNITSSVEVTGDQPWVEFDMEGGDDPPELDRLDLWLRRLSSPLPATGRTYIVTASDDRTTWKEVGRLTGTVWPSMQFSGPSFVESIPFAAPARHRYYRVQMSAAGIAAWGVAELALFDQGKEIHVGGPYDFSSAWMSAGIGEEWVYVDLGAICTFDRLALAWIQRPAAGAIQVSNDAAQWQEVQALTANSGLTDDIHLPKPLKARYVRVLMTKPDKPGDRYILSEMEVYGRGGPMPHAQNAFASAADGALDLARGAWRLQRVSLVAATGQQISQPGFSDADWMVATVPGTILASFLNDGAIANPDFGDYQYDVSDSYFCSDFWYRDQFVAPAAGAQRHIWLNFDGINWKAEVYLNGQPVGRIDGAFARGRFDVTELIKPGAQNALAVRIVANANPGGTKDKAGRTVNGGALGRDNPTFHASAGWDWISTIRGRNDGIWNNVTLTTTGPVRVENPLVTTALPLPDTTQADVSVDVALHNQESKAVSGTLHVSFGDVNIDEPENLGPGVTSTVRLTPGTNPELHLDHPKLWWPVGYGEPNLYPVKIEFITGGRVSDSMSFHAGVRQFTYSEDGGVLRMWINGRRFIARGGNWGFSESMLRYRAREYEAAMRYHRDLHFNMIRNWVGMTDDEAFYDAADRNGVVIWQDFWLANPWDGPNPDNNSLFLANAEDYLLRIRNHASLGLFCGRNEGYPPQEIDDGLRNLVTLLRPGSHYISSSADGPVSGHGPYRVEPLRYYFEHAPTKFHSEMGSPNVPETDILASTMPESALWPQGYQWPLHDYFVRSMYPQLHFPPNEVDSDFGGATNIADWDSLIQFVDYNSYRGMYEGSNENRLGLLIWMSHPAWPSLLWQTYDYFFDTDAGYFGAKHGAEPLHIQWNAATDAVEVTNNSSGAQTGLTAQAEVLNLDGSVKWEKTATLDSPEDSTTSPLTMQYPTGLSKTHFIRLTLSKDGQVLSRNFYLRGLVENDYTGIRDLGSARVEMKSRVKRDDDSWQLTANLHNVSKTPALMVRVKVVREKTGDPILPALFDDNYIALMPGESRTLNITVLNADTRGEKPRLTVEGYNVNGAPLHGVANAK
jgi:Exo-beta-D-glucosaminidase Ig-fold domain/Glycosyl hydrolases family 2/F5/8 type C domain/Glycosyl hydrolases family 2, sugar binding domain